MPKRSALTGPSFSLRTEVHRAQIPAKKASGRLASNANQTGGRLPSGSTSCSAKEVNGTTQRWPGPSQARQWGEPSWRMLVTPGSVLRPLR